MSLLDQTGYPTSGIKTLKGVSDTIQIQDCSGPVGTLGVDEIINKILECLLVVLMYTMVCIVF